MDLAAKAHTDLHLVSKFFFLNYKVLPQKQQYMSKMNTSHDMFSWHFSTYTNYDRLKIYPIFNTN